MSVQRRASQGYVCSLLQRNRPTSQPHPASHLMGTKSCCQGIKRPGPKLTTHCYTLPRLRMCRSKPLLPPYAFRACTDTALPFYLVRLDSLTQHALPVFSVSQQIIACCSSVPGWSSLCNNARIQRHVLAGHYVKEDNTPNSVPLFLLLAWHGGWAQSIASFAVCCRPRSLELCALVQRFEYRANGVRLWPQP